MTDLGGDWLNHVVLQRSIERGCWEMVAGYCSHTHPIMYCLKGEVESVNRGELATVIPVNNIAVQQMMDDLWHGGIRPSEGMSLTGQTESLQGEIKHLRAIVTRIINVEWNEDDTAT